jgi:hypothetical protein
MLDGEPDPIHLTMLRDLEHKGTAGEGSEPFAADADPGSSKV